MPPQAKARAGSAPAMYQPMMMSARHQPMMMMPANAIGMGLPGAVGGGAGPRAGTRVVQGTHAFNWGYTMPAGAYLQPQSAMFHIPSSRSAQPMSPVPVIQTGSGIRASYVAQPIMPQTPMTMGGSLPGSRGSSPGPMIQIAMPQQGRPIGGSLPPSRASSPGPMMQKMLMGGSICHVQQGAVHLTTPVGMPMGGSAAPMMAGLRGSPSISHAASVALSTSGSSAGPMSRTSPIMVPFGVAPYSPQKTAHLSFDTAMSASASPLPSPRSTISSSPGVPVAYMSTMPSSSGIQSGYLNMLAATKFSPPKKAPKVQPESDQAVPVKLNAGLPASESNNASDSVSPPRLQKSVLGVADTSQSWQDRPDEADEMSLKNARFREKTKQDEEAAMRAYVEEIKQRAEKEKLQQQTGALLFEPPKPQRVAQRSAPALPLRIPSSIRAAPAAEESSPSYNSEGDRNGVGREVEVVAEDQPSPRHAPPRTPSPRRRSVQEHVLIPSPEHNSLPAALLDVLDAEPTPEHLKPLPVPPLPLSKTNANSPAAPAVAYLHKSTANSAPQNLSKAPAVPIIPHGMPADLTERSQTAIPGTAGTVFVQERGQKHQQAAPLARGEASNWHADSSNGSERTPQLFNKVLPEEPRQTESRHETEAQPRQLDIARSVLANVTRQGQLESLGSPRESSNLLGEYGLPSDPFKLKLLGSQSENPVRRDNDPAAPTTAAACREATIGLGMLLEQTWVAKKNLEGDTLGISNLFYSMGDGREKVWRVKKIAPGFGADLSGAVCVGDTVLRIDGIALSGTTSLDDIAKLLRGPIGTSVKLLLEREPADNLSVSGSVSAISSMTGRSSNLVVEVQRTPGGGSRTPVAGDEAMMSWFKAADLTRKRDV